MMASTALGIPAFFFFVGSARVVKESFLDINSVAKRVECGWQKKKQF